MPIAAHEGDHRKFTTETRHAALADVAAAITDDFREFVNEACSIRPDGRDGDVLLHVGASVAIRRLDRDPVAPRSVRLVTSAVLLVPLR